MTDWWANSAAWATAVGTGSAAVVALYIASRGRRDAAVERWEERWEGYVHELGELLTTQLGERLQEVRLEQSIYRGSRQADTPGMILAERARKAQQVTGALNSLVRTRVYWLAERVISRQPLTDEIVKFELAYARYLQPVREIGRWSKDDDRTDAAFDEVWAKEEAARAELTRRINLLADMPHPSRAPRRGQSVRPAGGRYDLLGGPDPL